MNLIRLLTFVLFVSSTCNCYRILAIFPFHGRSHTAVLHQITKGLATKGHIVDVISHFPLRESLPSHRDILQLPSDEKYASIDYKTTNSVEEFRKWLDKKAKVTCDYLGLPGIRKLIEKWREHHDYDLLLIHYTSWNQCFNAIGHILNVPIVGIVTTSLYPWTHGFIGNPLNLAIARTNLQSHDIQSTNFFKRLYAFLLTRWAIYNYDKKAIEQEKIVEKHLGPGLPRARELERSIAMILSGAHRTYHGVQPKNPALIEIAGIHITNMTRPIDASLKRLLDRSEHGFIYFSFGSMAVVESFPAEILERFYAVFREISPVRIIMRTERPEILPEPLPDNLFTYPWLPQQQILQHPNIKAFVTHGGALGAQEAFYYAVPMICGPLFAEQHLNCDILARKGLALKIDFQSARQPNFDHAFRQILSNPIYKDAARNFSILFRDRPSSPKEEAVYWIEYIIRHGKNALRSPAVDMQWWQVELVDVYAFLFACVALTFGLFSFVIYLMFKSIMLLSWKS